MPRAVNQPLFDYGKLFLGDADHTEVAPDGREAAIAAVRAAVADGVTLRVRGSGHSLSGMTLPRAGERLVRTGGLDHYRIDAPGTLTAGAGAVLWDIRDFAESLGWRMPVYNGGWAGPSLGGYISAGGMGLRVPPAGSGAPTAAARSISEMHGGFWEHVASITLVDGRGRLREIGEHDPRFPWLFASCGQLGLIVEARLKLQPGDNTPPLTLGTEGRIPRANPLNPAETDGAPPPDGTTWLYWFSLLVPVAEELAAWDRLGAWATRHRCTIRPEGGWVGPTTGRSPSNLEARRAGYPPSGPAHAPDPASDGQPIGFRYVVRSRRFTPPLLYPRHEDFVLMGVMAAAPGVGNDASEAALIAAEREFVADGLANGWSLYAQAENLSRSLDFEAYLGPERTGRFRALKQEFDPDWRINPGEVFTDGTPPPGRAASVRARARTLARVLDLKEA